MKKQRLTYVKNILIPCLLFSVITGAATGSLIFFFKAVSSFAVTFSDKCYSFVRENPVFLPCLLLCALALGLLAAVILKKSRNCRGGGIPTSVAILRGLIPFNWVHSVLLLFPSAILSFFCGMPLGTEGPSVQIGTAVGRGTVRILAKNNQAWDRYIMTGGACAGFASATGAPLSGIFFAFEEAHRRFSPMIFMTASVAVISSSFVTELLCDLTGASFRLFDFDMSNPLPLSLVWVCVLIGIVSGFTAILFTKVYRFTGIFITKKLSKLSYFVKIPALFLLVALCGYFCNELLYSGHGLIETLVHGHGVWYMLLLYFCIRGIFLMAANHIGVTGGTFIPTLTFGSIVGSLCGTLLVSLSLLPEEYYGIAVIAGTVSFLSASSRTPITAVVFAAEALCGLTNLLPVCAAVTISFLVIESSGTAAFNETVVENKVEKEHKNKTALTVDAILTVKKGSFVVGKEIRDILWPPTCVVTSVKKNNGHSFATMEEGDVLTLHYKTYDPASSSEALEALLGKQESSAFSSIVTKTAANVPNL